MILANRAIRRALGAVVAAVGLGLAVQVACAGYQGKPDPERAKYVVTGQVDDALIINRTPKGQPDYRWREVRLVVDVHEVKKGTLADKRIEVLTSVSPGGQDTYDFGSEDGVEALKGSVVTLLLEDDPAKPESKGVDHVFALLNHDARSIISCR